MQTQPPFRAPIDANTRHCFPKSLRTRLNFLPSLPGSRSLPPQRQQKKMAERAPRLSGKTESAPVFIFSLEHGRYFLFRGLSILPGDDEEEDP